MAPFLPGPGPLIPQGGRPDSAVPVDLAGVIDGVSATSGAPVAVATLAGAISSQSGVSGALTVRGALAGVIAAQSGLLGNLTGGVAPSYDGYPATSLYPSGSIFPGAPVGALAGTIVGQSGTSGAVTVARALAGTIAAQSGASATLTVTASGARPLAGTVSAQSALLADLTGGVAPSYDGYPATWLYPSGSIFPGVPGGVVSLAGTIAAQSALSASLTVGILRPLAGTITAQSALSAAALTVRHPLTGLIVAQSAATGSITGGTPVVVVPGLGKFILRDVVVTIDGVDASDYVHGVSVEQERDMIDITSFVDLAYRNYLPGEMQTTFSLDMFADNGSVTAQTLRLAQTLGSTVFVAVKPHRDFESARNPAYAANCVVAFYEPLDAPVGDAAQSTATLRSTGAVQIIGVAVLAGQIDARAGLQATHTVAPTTVSTTTLLSPSTFLGP